ncbi:MAG: DUF4236 domain-containing protein [Paludibacteraceae bacterium]|nr:DUF4236 domain-containing protein [Paludibacteraceae bacterium]
MTFRFRRRIKVAPGIHLNIGKNGASTSIGTHGMSITTGSRGTYLNTSIPGTGMYNRQKIGNNSPSQNISNNGGCGGSVLVWFFLIISLPLAYFAWLGESIEWVILLGLISLICIVVIITQYVSRSNAKAIAEQNALDEKRRQREAERIGALPNYFEVKISEEFFNETKKGISSISDFLHYLLLTDFYDWLKKQHLPLAQGTDSYQLTQFMILSDIKTAFLAMGSSVDFKSKEGLALLLVTNALNSNEDIEFGMINLVSEETIKPAEDLLNGSYNVFNKEANSEKLVFANLIENYDKDAKLQYLIVLYRFLSIAAKADDVVTEQETNYLKQILTRARSIDNNVEVEKDIVATLNVSFEMIHAGKSDEYDIGKYIVRSQKCVISDIQAELNISRARVLSALKTLERVGIIEAEGNKRKVLINREGDVIRLLRGQTALGDNNEDNSTETPDIITTQYPIVHSEEQEDIILPESLGLDPLFHEVAKFVVVKQEGSVAAIQRKFEIGYNRAGKISDQLESIGIYGPNRGAKGHEVLIKDLNQLDDLLSRVGGSKPKASRAKAKSSANELDSLIGLDSVKKEVQTLTNFIKIQQKRAEQGLKSSSVSYHCVFTGNPGTGKTTVARIVADIYKNLGVLKKGHLVETDRAGLVAEYVGQTAVKTNKIIDSALDGVLFIDEAYSLVGGGESDYGKEAIATLLKRMEDDRERLVVILAGYTKDMKQFIDSNPGLQSRFNRYIEFPDYTSDELYQIFALSLKKYDYHITDDAKVALQHFFEDAVAHKDANFGNGRFVRNIFEKVLEHQANRLASESNLTTERLSEITIEDLP